MNPRPTRYDSNQSDDQHACLHGVTLGDQRNSSEQDVPQADQYHQQREQAEEPSMIAVVELPEIYRPCVGEIGEAKTGKEIEDYRLKQEEQEGKEAPRFHLS